MKEKYKPLLVAVMTFTLMLNVVTFLAGRARRDTRADTSPRAVAARLEVKGCRVEMLAPRPGETVGPTGVVEGTASIPEGTYLWVLDRRKSMNRWWPQGGGPARIEQGKWSVSVRYGTERDRGGELYFAAVVVDAGVHQQLEQWVVEAPQRGYRSIRFPETLPGCEIQMAAVRREP